MPEPAHYPGKQYFSPFALGVLGILKNFKKVTKIILALIFC
jgi:hypothetical protein